MANIFLAIPQWKKMPETEVERIAKELNLDGWKSQMRGFHPMFDISVTNLVNWAEENGHKIRIGCVKGDGNLPRVRAFQMGVWLDEYRNSELKCDYFMIVDEDISFAPEAIDVLMKDDKPIVGGIYTFKTDNSFYTGKVCTRFLEDERIEFDKPFKVRWLNGGFVMYKAETLLDLAAKYKEMEFAVDEDSPMGIRSAFALWCPFVHDRTFLSEDWAASQRARDAGYDIWADFRCDLVHWNAERGYKITLPKEDGLNESSL